MPVDPTRLTQQQFTDRMMQSEEVLQTNQQTKGGKADKDDKAKKTGGNLTVEHAGDKEGLGATQPNQGNGGTQPGQVNLPQPTVDPQVMMMLVQSLSEKTSANQTDSTGNQLAVSRQKMDTAIAKAQKAIDDEIKKEHQKHHKKGVGNWIEGTIDAVEFIAGAALVATGVGTVAGVALMATATVNAIDLGIQNDPHASAKLKKDMGIVTIVADVTIGVATLGVGVATGIASASAELAPDLIEDSIEMSDMSTQSTDDVPDDDMPDDDEDDVDDSDDESGDDVDSPDEDEGGLKQLEKMFDKELEEEFTENMSEDIVDDSGDADDSGDDDGKSMKDFKKGQIIKASVKATFGLYAKGSAIFGTSAIADQTWMNVTSHTLQKKIDDAESEVTQADGTEAQANMDIQAAISQMQAQVDQCNKINTDATNLLQAYNSSMTNTAIQGFA